MQHKSTAWFAALTAPNATWRFGLDILAADEMTPLEDVSVFDQNATDRLIAGASSVTLDTTANSIRSAQIVLRNTDGRYNVGPAGFPSGGNGSAIANGLMWFNVRYRPWIDLRTGFDSSGKEVYDRTYLGVFVLTQPDQQVVTSGAQTTINLLDKSALLADPYLVTNATLPTFTKSGTTVGGYAAGTSFDSAMIDLATKGGIPANRLLFAASSLTLPADYSISIASAWWDHLTALATSMSHVLFFDALGNLIREPDPRAANTPSVFTYTTGVNAIISALHRKTDFTQTYNHVVCVGGSSTTGTYSGSAQITDPSNPYHSNTIGDRIVYVGANGKLKDATPDPNIGSNLQAQASAQVYLAKLVGQQELVEIKGRHFPAFEAYDRVTLQESSSGLHTDFLVQKATWTFDTSGMALDISKFFAVGS